MGLNATTVGASNLERAIRHRMKICGIDSINDYRIELDNSDFEVKELIEEVVVPETWFFRNQQSFHALDSYIKEHWILKRKDKKLRVLSIPSSTGEEPYSLAMTLDKFGLTTDYFEIDAIDISEKLLVKARRGVYGKHSFRNKENDFADAYFDRIDDTFVLHDDIRNAVNFKQGNILMDELGNSTKDKYDVIFCRNLLIYFDRSTQVKAIENLYGLLHDDGLLFLGHAETGDYIKKHLVRAKYSRAFAYHKLIPETHAGKNIASNNQSKANEPIISNIPEKHARLTKTEAKIPRKTQMKFLETMEINLADIDTPTSHQENMTLRKVKILADKGNLKEASALCENYLLNDNTSAQGYYLLGIIREAEGKDELVGELFRKAVYLDPNHHEAMIHLALHAGRKGDTATAKKLHLRAQRVAKRIKT